MFYFYRMLSGKSEALRRLRKHFGNLPPERIVTAARSFPVTSRVDLQAALASFFQNRSTELVGIHTQFGHETLTFASLLTRGALPVEIGPLQHDEVDIGDPEPVRCLKHGLWLGREDGLAYGVLLTAAKEVGRVAGVHVEVAVPAGDGGAAFSEKFFRALEAEAAAGKTYRGRVISLETDFEYSGTGGSVKVHRLPVVGRDEVILPVATLAMLERNVFDFIRRREDLRRLGMPIKKGLLFYGPPGTGKTHTIRYLAGQLPEHTTLLITAEQIGLLDSYFQLARFLQPSMMVIEDVDLIARERTDLRSACEESLLNRLLNEMDGLREDAAVLFILTTNRPEQLEPALASRPGRIDQGVEFPLPDDEGRRKLVHLYSRGLRCPAPLVEIIVRKTDKASPAFIKELMRRCAQSVLENGEGAEVDGSTVDAALQELLFSAGRLNRSLLGATAMEAGEGKVSVQ